MAYHLKVLGVPELFRPDGSPVPLSMGKPLAALVLIACRNDGVSRDMLASLLWPDAPRDNGRHSVRQALWVVRNAVGDDLFQEGDPIRLRENSLETDLADFREALARGDVLRARELWDGPFLEHFVLPGLREWEHWMEDVRSDLERRYQEALLQKAREEAREGHIDAALGLTEEAIGVNSAAATAHHLRVKLLLDSVELDAAREALADAHRAVGDEPPVLERLRDLESRMEEIAREQRAHLQETEGFPLEFVGRSRELAELRRLWEDARSGRSRVALITGPAGIGKTRMAREFQSSLHGGDARVVAVRGSRTEMKLKGGVAAELVRQLLALPGSAGISMASDSLLRSMLPSLSRGDARPEVLNEVSPAALLDAVSDLLAAVAFESPLVLHLDDLQWADAESRILLLSLMRRVRDLPILFLAVGRKDLSSQHWQDVAGTLRREADTQDFLLSPLTGTEVEELLGLVADFSDPDEARRVARRIHDVSGGNPLFVREILGDFHDRGILRKEDGIWILDSRDLPLEFPLPDNIRGLLQERLHRLSLDAALLARILAQEGREQSVELLRRRSGLERDRFSHALAELFQREVVEWAGDTGLDFTHSLLGEVVRTHLPPLRNASPDAFRRFKEHPALAAVILLAVLAVPVSFLLGALIQREDGPPPPLAFGGGRIIFAGSPALVMAVENSPPEEWRVREAGLPVPPGAQTVFSGPDGEVLWLGAANHSHFGPDIVRILEDGTTVPVAAGPGDQHPLDVSPDGTRLLYASERRDTERFAEDLLVVPLEGGGPERLLMRAGTDVKAGAWSPDGDLIAVSLAAAEDTLLFLSLQGRRVASRPLGEIRRLAWCDSALMVIAYEEEELRIVRLSGPKGKPEILDTVPGAFGSTCSPDGTGFLQPGIRDGRPALLLRDLETGRIHRLRTHSLVHPSPRWLPPHLPPIPTDLEMSVDSVTLAWGEKRTVSANLRLSDGTLTSEGIRWESLDHAVATVDGGGRVTANGEGATLAVAAWGYSFRDTIRVRVLDTGEGGAAFYRDRFLRLDTVAWQLLGSPRPVVARRDGEPVLLLRGDEKYMDGLVLRRPLPLEQGITLEAEFRVPFTGHAHQNFEMCVSDMEVESIDPEVGSPGRKGEGVCFLFPARSFEKFDPREATLNIAAVEKRVRVPDAFSPDEWTHVAVQIRPDGQTTLVVNGEIVATAPVRLRTEPRWRWHFTVHGDAVDTEVLVREVTIWKEVRY